MAYPQIVYNDGSQDVILSFTYPPVNKAGGDELAAERHDTITNSGLRQSITERVDTFRTLEFPNVPNVDMPAWIAFMTLALDGREFEYYPDSENGDDHETWVIEDTEFKPKFAARGFTKFTISMRKVIADD